MAECCQLDESAKQLPIAENYDFRVRRHPSGDLIGLNLCVHLRRGARRLPNLAVLDQGRRRVALAASAARSRRCGRGVGAAPYAPCTDGWVSAGHHRADLWPVTGPRRRSSQPLDRFVAMRSSDHMPIPGWPHQQGRGLYIAGIALYVVSALLFSSPIVILWSDFFSSPPRWALLLQTAGLVIMLGNMIFRVFTHRSAAREPDTSPVAGSSTRHQ